MIKATVRIENSAGPGPCHFVSNLEIFGSNMKQHVSLCFIMFHYVSLCFIMFHYVSLCFIMFHYVSYVSQYEHNGFPAIGAGFPARHTPATYRQFVCDR